MKVIIYGASGMIGGGVLNECIKSSDVESILVVGRKSIENKNSKISEFLNSNLIPNADNASSFKDYDACYFCIGITSANTTEEDYTKLTYTLTLDVARALSKINPNMTFIYVSGVGADSAEHSKVMWERVRGKTENDLLKLPFKGIYIFRPSVVQPVDGVVSQTSSYRIFYKVLGPILPIARKLFPAHVSSTEKIGKAMIAVSKFGYKNKILFSDDFNRN